MKNGDLIFDHDLGRSGIVLDVLDTRPEEVHISYAQAGEVYYRVMYDDGVIDVVIDYEVELISESR